MTNEREQLISWLNILSVKCGEEFTLSSGQKSRFYIDVKKTSLHHQGCKLLAKLLLEKMKEFSPVEAVAGVVLGGSHLASIVAIQCPYPIDVIQVRKEAKDHGTKQLVERPVMADQAHVLVLEDVVTTGGSAIQAANLLLDEGLDVRGILAVVDRRAEKKPYLGKFKFAALIDCEELAI